jgi:Fe-S oxidoreductase
VDVAKLKAEFLQHYYDANGVPMRSKMIANFSAGAKLASVVPALSNFFMNNAVTGTLMKKVIGFAPKRSIPEFSNQTLQNWFKQYASEKTKTVVNPPLRVRGKVYLFCDEFSNYNDAHIGKTAVLLLEKLGYTVEIPEHLESARTWLSKGLIRKAKKIANQNIELLSKIISEETPLLGIEPSAILTFRDEYPDLATDDNLVAAQSLAKHAMMMDEFLEKEMQKGNIKKEQFTNTAQLIQLHGHCQQKAVGSVNASVSILSFPENYKVEVIPSGCCGMAGSFGYEAEHYELSMQIGEMVLFPAVRSKGADVLVAAPGTSCRHQIKDGTGKKALHPVEILYKALQ